MCFRIGMGKLRLTSNINGISTRVEKENQNAICLIKCVFKPRCNPGGGFLGGLGLGPYPVGKRSGLGVK